MIAILYKVEFAVSEGLTSPTCTEVKCKFNDMSKNVVKGCKVKDLIYEKQMLGKKITKSSINSHVKKLCDPRSSCESSIIENDFFDEWSELKPTSGILLCVSRKAIMFVHHHFQRLLKMSWKGTIMYHMSHGLKTS